MSAARGHVEVRVMAAGGEVMSVEVSVAALRLRASTDHRRRVGV